MKKPMVLFLCTGNSCRSQMAEALLRRRAGDRFEACSAGADLKGIHSLTIQVLQEIGIDTSNLRSKHVSKFLGKPIDHLIVVCDNAQRSCPTALLVGVKDRRFWPFEDPPAFVGDENEKLAKFRQVRDEIDERIKQWLESGAPS
jgi:arsenate reductase